MQNQKKYSFLHIANCEVCGSDTSKHKILGQRLNQSQGLKPRSKSGISITVQECTNCRLIYAQPQPIPNDIQDHYGIPPESYWTQEYFTWQPSYFATQLEIVKDLLPFQKGMKALDIGAGIGKAMLSMEHVGFDAYGFEPSKSFYERAISKMNIPESKIRMGMVEQMDYEPNSFDFITFGAVFEHLYNPAVSLKQALTWLKPNGIIQIEVPNSRHLIPRIVSTFYKLIGTNYVSRLSPMHSPFHMHEFHIKTFEELGKKINFVIEKTVFDVCTIYYFPNIIKPILRKYMELTNTGMQLTVYIRKTN